jgi:hypothetical protein
MERLPKRLDHHGPQQPVRQDLFRHATRAVALPFLFAKFPKPLLYDFALAVHRQGNGRHFPKVRPRRHDHGDF